MRTASNTKGLRIDIFSLSNEYTVKRLDDSDVDEILGLCLGNTLFYRYAQAELTREQILDDLHIAPPGKTESDKYYVGFYSEDRLVAVMDLIDGFPEDDIAFIGFFMMDVTLQGRGIGTKIITEVADSLKAQGFKTIRLAIDKDNPQSNHFWKKNGFHVIREVDRDEHGVLVSERVLDEHLSNSCSYI